MNVLAVVVMYRRRLAQVRPWPTLCCTVAKCSTTDGPALRHVLLYDNSPQPLPDAPRAWPAAVTYRHDAANGGTAAAYAAAAALAASLGDDFVLLLDDDSDLPEGFLSAAGHACDDNVSALLPRVVDGTTPVSPARIDALGRVRPLAVSVAPTTSARLTAIASGALVRTGALASVLPFPPGLWLDYVDHWLFAQLRRRGGRLIPFDAVVAHRLSILDPTNVESQRQASILDGEARFVATLPLLARAVHPLRLALRALRLYARGARTQSRAVARAALQALAGTRP